MCSAPKVPQAQQYQVAKEAVYSDGDEEDARRRGRRGTILAEAGVGAAPNPAGGKTLLGQ